MNKILESRNNIGKKNKELNKNHKKFLKENWKECIGFLYNNIDEEVFFDLLLDQYEPTKGFFKVLQMIILVNKNWFTSNISFETKIALLKELLGEDNEAIHNIQTFCESCGSKEFIYESLKSSQKLYIRCKYCGKEVKELEVQDPEF